MAKKKTATTAKPKETLVSAVHPANPDLDYYLPAPNRALEKKLAAKPRFPRVVRERPITKTMTLFPERSIAPSTGYGYYVINIDGFRMINAYVISDPLNSSAYRGFTLQLSFALHPFVYGVGVDGETNYFFNFDSFYNQGVSSQPTIQCETSDLTTTGGLPRIGGRDLAHILRVPVMGPYVRATVMNKGNQTRKAKVEAYLST